MGYVGLSKGDVCLLSLCGKNFIYVYVDFALEHVFTNFTHKKFVKLVPHNGSSSTYVQFIIADPPEALEHVLN